MSNSIKTAANCTIYMRPVGAGLLKRLREPRRFLQVITGPRQVGKTTLATQVAEKSGLPYNHVTADVPGLRSLQWIAQQWETARNLAESSADAKSLLIVDEIQKIPDWSEMVKLQWDQDTRDGCQVEVIVLGSTSLAIQKGLTESLAGRFELTRLPHWSFAEMQDVFNYSVEEYLFYGGYPGAASLIGDHQRWSDYIRYSLIEPIINRDILLLTRVDKPALLRRLFDLGCRCSGQILSYNKMLGQLQDAGNTTTLAHYLDLLSQAGMLTGLQKYSGHVARQRGSSPKFQVLNTALLTVECGRTMREALIDSQFKGQLVESAVGAYLANAASIGQIGVSYWRQNNREVDFVVERGTQLYAIEVKSGRSSNELPGIALFSKSFNPKRVLLIGESGISVDDFLSRPVEHWFS